jgi:hypothetical protein
MKNAELVAKSEDLNLKSAARLRNEAKMAANNAEKTRVGENRRKTACAYASGQNCAFWISVSDSWIAIPTIPTENLISN